MQSAFWETAKRKESTKGKVEVERGCSHRFFQWEVLSYISNDVYMVIKIHMEEDKRL